MSSLSILGGLYRGRKIRSNFNRNLRPTSSKVRKSLFDILGNLSGYSVLYLFAGTGLVGFEAASRGASSVVFVEKNKKLSDSISKNSILFCEASIIVERQNSYMYLNNCKSQFDIIFADPPYNSIDLNTLLELSYNNLRPKGQIIIESSTRQNWSPKNGKIRTYGDTQLTFFNNE